MPKIIFYDCICIYFLALCCRFSDIKAFEGVKKCFTFFFVYVYIYIYIYIYTYIHTHTQVHLNKLECHGKVHLFQ